MRNQSASRIAVMVLLLIPYLPVILLLLPRLGGSGH